MRILSIQHVPYEGLGTLGPLLAEAGHTLGATRPYAGESFPPPTEFDALVVLGGPMGVCDLHPPEWMPREREFIARCLDAQRPVLGICLGGQLLASVLGADVRRHDRLEVGWHRLRPTAAGRDSALSPFFAPGARVVQWHQDTFEIPAGAERLCGTEACENQAFAWGDRVLALQFHPEMTLEEAAAIAERDGTGPAGPFVQGAREILDARRFERLASDTRLFVSRLLAAWEAL
jgi:GMP synthase-like glutamine amidotransferase